MDIQEVINMLPNEPREGMLEWGLEVAAGELGGELTIFYRESVELRPELQPLMTYADWQERDRNTHRRWGARCECTACGDDYIAGWAGKNRGGAAIRLGGGEDGVVYDGWISQDDPMSQIYAEGEPLNCPLCGEYTKLAHSSKLRYGRTYAAMIGSVERAGKYAALVFWLIRRKTDEFGIWDVEIRPREAVVLDEKGRRWRFSKTSYGEFAERPIDHWEHRTFQEPEQLCYYSWGSGDGPKRNTIGAFWWPDTADLTGTTGEKSAIDEYVKLRGSYPVLYLSLWEKCRSVEALIKAGWAEFVSDEISRCADQAHMYRSKLVGMNIDWINWEFRKPSQLLRMSKEEVKTLARYHWDAKKLKLWLRYTEAQPQSARAMDFLQYINRYPFDGVESLIDMHADGWPHFELPRVMRYLDKQTDIRAADRAQTFKDYRTMLEMRDPGNQPSPSELWPPHLLAAHNRLAQSVNLGNDAQYVKGFLAIKAQYSALEWTDGELCIVVPTSNSELVEEGKKLDHCVGDYGKSHCEGKPIFFVRRYRRPERSYFTLNENLTGDLPKRIQLHGYKNENISGKHLKIPQHVLDFVERWEREVLKPWFIAQRGGVSSPVKKNNNKRSAA